MFAYLIYFTSTQIKRFKPLCYIMDTRYLFWKIMQYKQNNSYYTPYIHYLPYPPRYPPTYVANMPSQTWGMMMFAKFFWEIFLVRKKGPYI